MKISIQLQKFFMGKIYNVWSSVIIKDVILINAGCFYTIARLPAAAFVYKLALIESVRSYVINKWRQSTKINHMLASDGCKLVGKTNECKSPGPDAISLIVLKKN